MRKVAVAAALSASLVALGEDVAVLENRLRAEILSKVDAVNPVDPTNPVNPGNPAILSQTPSGTGLARQVGSAVECAA